MSHYFSIYFDSVELNFIAHNKNCSDCFENSAIGCTILFPRIIFYPWEYFFVKNLNVTFTSQKKMLRLRYI